MNAAVGSRRRHGFRDEPVIFGRAVGAHVLADLSLTISPEQPDDSPLIERLYERTFGPGRFARTAYRLRESRPHRLDLSFIARIGTLLVGSVRLTPIRIGTAPAMLLGPLTVEPPFREHGIGRSLLDRAVEAARDAGVRLVLLVGDEPFYAASGFKRVPRGRITLPGPVDPNRILIAELTPGALGSVEGRARADYGVG